VQQQQHLTTTGIAHIISKSMQEESFQEWHQLLSLDQELLEVSELQLQLWTLLTE
jgi:hypothetical protein